MSTDIEHGLKNYVDKLAGLKEPQKLTKELFINIPMWFDANETSPTLNSKQTKNSIYSYSCS